MQLDTENKNTLWAESIKTEFKQINDYETFRVLENHEHMPPGYKRIPYHCIYDVKFDGRRKCRLVAGGHRTDPKGRYILRSRVHGSCTLGFHFGK
jgi:hypothetical protein